MIDFLLSEPFLVRTAIAVVAAVGMNLVYVTGQLNLGQAGFLAVGAYTLAVVDTEWGWPLALSLPAAAAMSAVVALPVALGATRVRGIYLIMGTLAVGEVVRATISSIDAVGGYQGYLVLGGISPTEVAVTLTAVLAVALAVMAGSLGVRMRAIFDDEDAAAAAGVATRRVKVTSVVLSAAVVGVSGGLLAKFQFTIAPDDFGIAESFEIALFTLIGGVHSLVGAVVGTVVVSSLLQVLRRIGELAWLPDWLDWLPEWRGVVYGGLVMVAMAVLPEGLVSRAAALRLTAPLAAWRRRSVPLAVAYAAPPHRPVDPGTVLEVERVSHRFGGIQALDDVSLRVAGGEIVALVGANGAGKSTLIDIVGGRHPCQEGAIRLGGADITRLRPEARVRNGVARSFQSLHSLDHLTVEETLRLGRLGAAGRTAPTLDELLVWLGLDGRRRTLPPSLTLAEQRRLEIGRAFASAPHLLMLDEPSVGMSPEERTELSDLVRRLRSYGTAILLVDHNLDVALGVADRVVVLDFGRVLATGTPDAVVADPLVQAAYLGAPAGARDTP